MQSSSSTGCCKWMRSANDLLVDPSTNVGYCSACWQRWVGAKTARSSATLGKQRKSSDNLAADMPTLEERDEAFGDLEKFTDKDGRVYLISRERSLAFHAENTLDGRLQCVGEVNFKGSNISIKFYKVNAVAKTNSFPFPTSPEDHCETPFVAYEDLARYLQYYGKQIGKNRRSLKIWDPFYCNGAVKHNLARLGFFSVYNECEDFYAIIRNGHLPEHDCIVTNPPYSTEPTDHIDKLLQYLCSQKKPWFVLQPNYVYTKPFWQELTESALQAPRPFFLTPNSPRKYKYQTPSGIRPVSSARMLKTSPFVSMWYCWLGQEYLGRMFKWIASMHTRDPLPLTLACSEFFIPDSFKDSSDRTRRKKRKASKKVPSQVDDSDFSPDDSQSHISKRVKRKTA